MGGIRKPTAVPMMLTTERIARAKDRCHNISITFYCLNHRIAILVGAFRMKG